MVKLPVMFKSSLGVTEKYPGNENLIDKSVTICTPIREHRYYGNTYLQSKKGSQQVWQSNQHVSYNNQQSLTCQYPIQLVSQLGKLAHPGTLVSGDLLQATVPGTCHCAYDRKKWLQTYQKELSLSGEKYPRLGSNKLSSCAQQLCQAVLKSFNAEY